MKETLSESLAMFGRVALSNTSEDLHFPDVSGTTVLWDRGVDSATRRRPPGIIFRGRALAAEADRARAATHQAPHLSERILNSRPASFVEAHRWIPIQSSDNFDFRMSGQDCFRRGGAIHFRHVHVHQDRSGLSASIALRASVPDEASQRA